MLSRLWGLLLGLVAGCGGMMPAIAQPVTPTTGSGDVGTTITDTGAYTITGGTQRLDTVFHSFEDFSPGRSSVNFDVSATPSANIVLGRVTGGNASFIDGQLSLTGGNSPDLFFINPNGINFGSNARLNLPGSFIATTAASVLFNNGLEFSAVTPSEAPLLTVSTPTELQFGTGLSDAVVPTIEVVNTGHTLISPGPGIVVDVAPNVGLRIAPNETLALLGPDIRMMGGMLSNTSGGQLHVGSPQSLTLGLVPSDMGWRFDYQNIGELGSIHLSDRALVDTSSTAVGQLTVDTESLTIESGSLLLARNYGSQPAPDLTVRATGDIAITGVDSSSGTILSSNITTGTFNTGRGGNIDISANNISAQGGGQIFATNSGPGQGGNVALQVTDSLSLAGVGGPGSFSLIGASTAGSGNAGDVMVSGPRLRLADGAVLITTTFASGDSGNLNVNISESIDVEGFSLLTGQSSAITAITLGSGNAGDVMVNTQQLTLRNAGGLDSSTFSSGNAGSVTVNATQEIRIEESPQAPIPLRLGIASSAALPSETFRSIFGLPALPTGSAGNVTVSTPILVVADQGEVAVTSRGTGDGGTLTIRANQVFLDQGGNISALTEVGNGGDIALHVGEVLLMRNNSFVSAESRGVGNGGNLVLNSPLIIGWENSDILASAVSGDGGDIAITTQGLLGLDFRDQLTPGNDINASSQFGVSGTVSINGFTTAPGASVVKLPEAPVDVDNQVATACDSGEGNQFVASGRGGLPVSPVHQLLESHPWIDVRDVFGLSSSEEGSLLTTTRDTRHPSEEPSEGHPSADVREAKGWQTNERGQIELLMATSLDTQLRPATHCLTHSSGE